jgi:hypothetical protein
MCLSTKSQSQIGVKDSVNVGYTYVFVKYFQIPLYTEYIVQMDLYLLKSTGEHTLHQDTSMFRTPCVHGLDTILRTNSINRLALYLRLVMFYFLQELEL